MFNLSRYFSTLTLILIGLAAGLLGTMYREVSVRQMTMLAEDRNVAMARVIENSLGAPLAGLMAASVGIRFEFTCSYRTGSTNLCGRY